METASDKGNCKTHKLPRDPLTVCALKAFESQAKETCDHKRTCTEQTNGKRMNYLQHFTEVGKALLGMHDEGSDVNVWLKKEIPKWEELTGALFDVHCYLKSQRKRNPIECDNKMNAL